MGVNLMQQQRVSPCHLSPSHPHHPVASSFLAYNQLRKKQLRSASAPPWPASSPLCKPRRKPLRLPASIISKLSDPPVISALVSDNKAGQRLVRGRLGRDGKTQPMPFQSSSPSNSATSLAERDLDYKEAAAVLEHLFTESPSLGDVCGVQESSDASGASTLEQSPATASTISSKKSRRRRKDLMTRISLTRNKSVPRPEPGIVVQSSKDLSHSIWSPAVSKLVRQYGDTVNVMAQNWSNLPRHLLTVEEQRWLGTLMKPAKALQELKDVLKKQHGTEPSDEEWAQAAQMDVDTLLRHLAVHRAARSKLVKYNLRLVKHQARKYERDASMSSLSVLDLCQEGVKGLIIAVEKYDPSKGFRFSTYAIFWIRNSILRAQTRSGFPIRAPFNFAELRMNINKIKWDMRMDGLGDKVEGEAMLKELLERAGVDEERYKVVMRSVRRPVSLNSRDRVTGAELVEHMADSDAGYHHSVPSRYLIGGTMSNPIATDPSVRLGIDDVLDSLKPKESLVLRQRFGLDGKGERSLGEIGRSMRISREMVRKYEARGLLKLKHPTRLAYLRSFLSRD